MPKEQKTGRKPHQWVRYNRELMKLDERNVHKELLLELKTKRRKSYVRRLFGRYNALRRVRELGILMNQCAE